MTCHTEIAIQKASLLTHTRIVDGATAKRATIVDMAILSTQNAGVG